ncbi:uncharacterized protein BXZ73DRAFT_38913 [Epithele typhae]|uniref:uncharacterized protein n=1 Tax=Epithele typhae TaxID=378194 RepID=UPI00200809F8|nr:uncharacterized protein BXZ73DRAFT_38913 [Epithele typhae]KAH9944984.1 hypothetical protein BXZ73DRAFT_38913 [Epithele typhae]
MQPSPLGHSAHEKASEADSGALVLAPPPSPAPRGYRFTVYLPTLNRSILQGRPRNARRRHRFWPYFACAFFTFFALHLLLNQPRWRRWHRIPSPSSRTSGPLQCFEKVVWDATDFDLQGDFPHRARTSVELPLSADQLYFVAEGALSHGSFEVVQAPIASSDVALVDVQVSYHSHEALLDAAVCRLNPAPGKWGFGIFTPGWQRPRHERMLKFDIRLTLPSAPPDEPLKLHGLRTDLPLFSHHVRELGETARFARVEFESQNTPLWVDSLTADQVVFRTTNSAIHGRYNVSSDLELMTTNAAIVAHADLLDASDREELPTDARKPPRLSLHTSNGLINATVRCYHNRSSNARGNGVVFGAPETPARFAISAHTTDAPLALAVHELPAHAVLAVTATTSNAPAQVELPRTFEGGFVLTSSTFFRPTLNVTDALGRRVTSEAISRSSVCGAIRLGQHESEGEDEGMVDFQTSNAPIRLLLP